MRALLLALSLAAAPALAQSDDCSTLRRALALAERAGVDSGELWRLERQACAPAQPSPGGGVCQQLDAFWILSLALGEGEAITGTLEAQRGVWCSRPDEPTRPLQWSNGATLRSTTGTLSWPNGTIARSTSGSWYADSGTMVKSSSGTLYYPSGSQARSSSGRSMLPSGELADEGRIAALACQADTSWCRYFLDAARGSSGVRRDFASLGLGILAGRAAR